MGRRGNDGSGWSMSVWPPRRIDRTGQDSPSPTKDYPVEDNKKRPQPALDEEKFRVALTKRIGQKQADAYIRRQKRKKMERTTPT